MTESTAVAIIIATILGIGAIISKKHLASGGMTILIGGIITIYTFTSDTVLGMAIIGIGGAMTIIGGIYYIIKS